MGLAAARYPEGRLRSISMPEDAKGVYQVGREGVPGLSAFWSERIVSVDQYSGAILDVRALIRGGAPAKRLSIGNGPCIRGKRSACPAACSCAPVVWPVR
ncbi:MAG: PepSY domain-containing protein [Nitrospira sp.]